MCPSYRGLPSQAFEYILYNKGIMGEDTYPYRGKVTVGGLSCVSSHHCYPPPPCCHSKLASSWCLSVPSALTKDLSSCSCLCSTISLSECPSSGPSHLSPACLVPYDSTGPLRVIIPSRVWPPFIRKHLTGLTLELSDQLGLYTYLGQSTMRLLGSASLPEGQSFPSLCPQFLSPGNQVPSPPPVSGW